MNNELVLLQGDDYQNMRHGGMRQYRTFTLYLNGIVIEQPQDDSAAWNWSSGKYLDDTINARLDLLEKALRCTTIIAEKKNRTILIHPAERFKRAPSKEAS